jgi:hypothetical protein
MVLGSVARIPGSHLCGNNLGALDGWTTIATPPPADIRGHGLLDLIHELFAPYHLFIEPSDLPLAHEWSHRIQLLPGTRAVMMRRYRCAHAQENELEC